MCRRQSHSRSSTPEMVQSKVEYITEFGATSDNDEGNVVIFVAHTRQA